LYFDFMKGNFDTYRLNGKLMLKEKFHWPTLVENLDELYL